MMFLLILAAFCEVNSTDSFASESESATPAAHLKETVLDRPFQTYFGTSFVSIGKSSQTILGLDLTAGIKYTTSKKFAVSAGYHQGFNSFGFASMYASLEGKGTYAITGTMLRRVRTIELDNNLSYSEISPSISGFRAELGFSQYFFSGTTSIYPYSGIGAGLLYEFSFQSPFGIQTGLRYDITTGANSSSLSLIQGVFQIIFWM